jgi:hypothetical protein
MTSASNAPEPSPVADSLAAPGAAKLSSRSALLMLAGPVDLDELASAVTAYTQIEAAKHL